MSWATPVAISTKTNITHFSVWYDRWSGINAGLIHVAYTDSTGSDTSYRSIDTESSDTLSSETTIFNGVSAVVAGSSISITRARGGNLFCKATIDAGAEGGFSRSTDVGANWGSRTNTEALATTDQWLLVPGFAADNQDIMCIFWDASADEISRYVHDDSANSWAETSIATSMVDQAASTNYPHFAVAVDLTNSQILLAAWSAIDASGADLLAWTITESAITALTNVVTDSTDDQGLCAFCIDTDNEDWYVIYAGLTDGSEIYATTLKLYYKKSTDDGSTWGSETALDSNTGLGSISGLFTCPREATNGQLPSVVYLTANDTILLGCEATVPTPGGGSGGAHILGGTVVR